MITDHQQDIPQKSPRSEGWRLTAIAVVLAICSGSDLVMADYSDDQFFGAEMLAPSPSAQTVSDVTSLPPVTREAIPYMASDSRAWYRRLTLGGYGELHVNANGDPNKDIFDLHRQVLFLGYEFSDWLVFSSELEVEHAFVSKDSGGELGFEQAYIEYLHSDCLHVVVGRLLTPVGIINPKHEPTSFNGVERPSFAKVIIPSTWSVDGVGLRGYFRPGLKYQAYLVTSLDGSKFGAKNGIRDGRIKERGSLHEMAFTGRLDFFPFALRPSPCCQTLRMGISTFLGGLDNGNKGADPGIKADIGLVSTDFEYSVGRFDFRGVFAFEKINGAAAIGNGTASEILGGYIEGAVHILPNRWRCGRLRRADLVAFVRYDDFDTQYRMPAGIARNLAGDRTEWTFGFTFLPLPNFALKIDYQVPDDATTKDLANKVNIGAGWQF